MYCRFRTGWTTLPFWLYYPVTVLWVLSESNTKKTLPLYILCQLFPTNSFCWRKSETSSFWLYRVLDPWLPLVIKCCLFCSHCFCGRTFLLAGEAACLCVFGEMGCSSLCSIYIFFNFSQLILKAQSVPIKHKHDVLAEEESLPQLKKLYSLNWINITGSSCLNQLCFVVHIMHYWKMNSVPFLLHLCK